MGGNEEDAPIPAVRRTAIRTVVRIQSRPSWTRSVKAPALAVVRSQRWPSLDRVQPKTPAMTAAMNPIVASQAQRPMMRSMFMVTRVSVSRRRLVLRSTCFFETML